MKKLSYSSTGHDDKQSHKNEKPSLIPISWAILVMGLPLRLVITFFSYLWIGHIGSTYSAFYLLYKEYEENNMAQHQNPSLQAQIYYKFHLL